MSINKKCKVMNIGDICDRCIELCSTVMLILECWWRFRWDREFRNTVICSSIERIFEIEFLMWLLHSCDRQRKSYLIMISFAEDSYCCLRMFSNSICCSFIWERISSKRVLILSFVLISLIVSFNEVSCLTVNDLRYF